MHWAWKPPIIEVVPLWQGIQVPISVANMGQLDGFGAEVLCPARQYEVVSTWHEYWNSMRLNEPLVPNNKTGFCSAMPVCSWAPLLSVAGGIRGGIVGENVCQRNEPNGSAPDGRVTGCTVGVCRMH